MGFVYVGQGTNKRQFKIGCTDGDLREQLAQHKTCDPAFSFLYFFETPHPHSVELSLKARFEAKRMPGATEWFHCSEKEISAAFAALPAATREHLTSDQEDEIDWFKNQKSSGIFLSPDKQDEVVYARLSEIKVQLKQLKLEEALLMNPIKFRIACDSGIEGMFSWSSVVQHRFDSLLLKKQFPDTYQACRRATVLRRFLIL